MTKCQKEIETIFKLKTGFDNIEWKKSKAPGLVRFRHVS